MESSFVIPGVLFVVCLAIRFGYESLKESRRIHPENKVIFVLIFSSMCALWVSWFTLCPADPLRVELPSPVRWIGLAIFIFGTILAVGALLQLRGVENIDRLVTGGLFKKLRHPMYLGFISWIVGWSIYHSAIASLGIGVLGIASVLWWRRLEDARLEVQFGRRYHEYRLTTWF
jgi:protein-S-isoprenylcysteine O-methyltransferase Ste14